MLIGQLVKIMRDGEELRLSKRAGTIVTLDELVDEIGVDALRYSLARYPADSPLTLDVAEITKASQRQPRLLRAVRPRPDLPDDGQRRRPRDDAARRRFDPSLLAHEREGELLRALAEFPRVVASAAELREPHRVARYLEDTAAVFNKWYDTKECRMLPQGDEPVAAGQRGPAAAGRRPPAPCSPTASTCSASPRPSGCDAVPTSHPSGWAHADGALPGVRRPHWLREPDDANALVPHLWSSTARKDDGVLERRRRRAARPGRRARHARRTSSTRTTSAARARAFRDAFADYDVFYAGKAFLCTTVARWVAEEGLHLDVCSGGELTVAERAGFDPWTGSASTATTSRCAELRRAVDARRGPDHRRLLRRDRAAGRRSPPSSAARPA